MAPTVVQTAQLRPGVCFLSGDFNGPFIDTGKSFREVGRVYLSLKALEEFMRAAGWFPGDEVESTLAEIEEREASIQTYVDEAGRYRDIIEALEPLLPVRPEVVREVGIFKDDTVRAQNEALKAEVAELSARLHEAVRQVTQPAAPPAPTSEGSAPEPGAAVPSPSTVVVADQDVDIDALLARAVVDIVAVAGDWPDEAKEALVAREAELRDRISKPARKTLLAGLYPTEEVAE